MHSLQQKMKKGICHRIGVSSEISLFFDDTIKKKRAEKGSAKFSLNYESDLKKSHVSIKY